MDDHRASSAAYVSEPWLFYFIFFPFFLFFWLLKLVYILGLVLVLVLWLFFFLVLCFSFLGVIKRIGRQLDNPLYLSVLRLCGCFHGGLSCFPVVFSLFSRRMMMCYEPRLVGTFFLGEAV